MAFGRWGLQPGKHLVASAMAPELDKLTDALKTALSAAGAYKLALAVVCGAYYYAAKTGVIPGAEPWELRASFLGALLFGVLWIASALIALLNFVPPRAWILHYVDVRKERAHLRSYIPNMTPKEREIIGYLLSHNQKLFIGAYDGGHAIPLISQRIAIMAVQPNQAFDFENTPFVIPDHLWSVLQEHRSQFPWNARDDDEAEAHPWRIHWMER
jgi:hypothetical protein